MTNPRPSKRQRTTSSSLPETINGFTLLPITLPSPLPSVPPAIHSLYLRRNEETPRPPAVTSTDPSRTIFVVNIPIDSTKELLRGLFASFGGRLEDVRFHGQSEDELVEENLSLPDVWDRRLRPSGGTAHITFPTSNDVDKVLKAISKELRHQTGPLREWGVGVEKSISALGLKRNHLLFQTDIRIPYTS
jgi:ribosomal RNA-processing protein 7